MKPLLDQFLRLLKRSKKPALWIAVVIVTGILVQAHKTFEALKWLEDEVTAAIRSAVVVNAPALEVEVKSWLPHAIVAIILASALFLITLLILLGHRLIVAGSKDAKLNDLEGLVQSQKGRMEELRAQIDKLEKERDAALTNRAQQEAAVRNTLERMMSAAFKITQQMAAPGPKKHILEIENSYLVGTNYDGQVKRKYVIEAVDVLHFWEIRVVAESVASPQALLDDIDFKVRDENDEPIIYLPIENGPHSKVVALFFLPALAPGQRKTVSITYKWAGLFKHMEVEGYERAEWNLTKESTDVIPQIRYSFYVDKALNIRITGDVYGWTGGVQVIRQTKHPEYAWPGITYEIQNATPGTYALRVALG